jgi:hypothetical protein
VWKRGFLAWEYQEKHADLGKAYPQLLQYREALQNPPLLIVSDIDRIAFRTNVTNPIKHTHHLALDDVLQPTGLAKLRAVFSEPEVFRVPQMTQQGMKTAAREFARLADLLRQWGEGPTS